MTRIVLDAGHGGHDPGAVGPTGLREKDVALAIVFDVERQLTARGLTVLQTRIDDTFMSLDLRTRFANERDADYLVSVHINAAINVTAHGTETFALSAGTSGAHLAAAIQAQLVAAIGLRDRGVKFANFAVLRGTRMPAALVEVAFINNPVEEKLMRDPAFLSSAGTGIARGILGFLGLQADPVDFSNAVIAAGSSVRIVGPTWATGEPISAWVLASSHTVDRIEGDRALIRGLNSWARRDDLRLA